MNSKEFQELQNQLGEILYSYEQFCKKGFLLDLKYNINFDEDIAKEMRISSENTLLYNVASMISKKMALKDIDDYIEKVKKDFNQKIEMFQQKSKNLKVLFDNMKDKPTDSLEIEFKNYVMQYHPAIKKSVSKQEGSLYEILKKLYWENNYSGFLAVKELNQNTLCVKEFVVEEYTNTAEFYYNTMEQIKIDITKKKQMFPFNKEEVLEDEISLAQEHAEYKIRLNKALGMNKSLHKDIMNLYGEDIIL